MTEPSLGRFLILLIMGLAVFDTAFTYLLAEPIIEQLYFLLLAPLCIALIGRGGRFAYYIGLLSAALLALLIPVFALILTMDITGFEPIDYDQDPIAILALSVMVIWGVVGVISFLCIRSTHPDAPSAKRLRGSVGDLLITMLISILWIAALNFGVLMFAIVFQGWSYSEIIWVYYLDTLAFLVISAKAMNKLENYDLGDAEDFSTKPRGKLKQEMIDGYLMSGGVFLLVYAILFTFTLVPPTLYNLIFVAFIGMGFVALHYHDFKRKLPKLEAEKPNIEKLQQGFGVRILPMHLTAMLAVLLLVADDEEMRSLTMMILFVFLKVTIDIISEIVEFFRECRLIMAQDQTPTT